MKISFTRDFHGAVPLSLNVVPRFAELSSVSMTQTVKIELRIFRLFLDYFRDVSHRPFLNASPVQARIYHIYWLPAVFSIKISSLIYEQLVVC